MIIISFFLWFSHGSTFSHMLTPLSGLYFSKMPLNQSEGQKPFTL